MIEGCQAWAERGLDPPPAVIEATAAYFETEDALGRWIDEECAIDPIYSGLFSVFFASWKMWAEAAGEKPGSDKRFSQALESRGFERSRGPNGERMFSGLAVKP